MAYSVNELSRMWNEAYRLAGLAAAAPKGTRERKALLRKANVARKAYWAAFHVNEAEAQAEAQVSGSWETREAYPTHNEGGLPWNGVRFQKMVGQFVGFYGEAVAQAMGIVGEMPGSSNLGWL